MPLDFFITKYLVVELRNVRRPRAVLPPGYQPSAWPQPPAHPVAPPEPAPWGPQPGGPPQGVGSPRNGA